MAAEEVEGHAVAHCAEAGEEDGGVGGCHFVFFGGGGVRETR